jgi:outer membrane receptor for ferrienterochelin and colicins
MLLPRLSSSDPRTGVSPVWSLQNIQFTYSGLKKIELYGGVKNLLNWTPGRSETIFNMRAAMILSIRKSRLMLPEMWFPVAANPYALTFDPGYVYAPNQGIRGFLGVRLIIK